MYSLPSFGESMSNTSALTDLFSSHPDSESQGRYPSDTDSQHSSTLGSIDNPTSIVAAESKVYMFPNDKIEGRKMAKRLKGFTRKARHAKLNVKFADIAKFYVYDSDLLPYGDEGLRWADRCEVHLLTGQTFCSYEEDFSHLSAKIYSDEAIAREYWKQIMLKGCPILQTRENQDGMLNNATLVTEQRCGVLPLLGDFTAKDLVDPEPSELLIYRTSSSRSIESLESAQIGRSMEEYFDDVIEKDTDGGTSEFSVSLPIDNSYTPRNVYKDIPKMTDELRSEMVTQKAESDYKGLQRYVVNFQAIWKKWTAEDLGEGDLRARESVDAGRIDAICKRVVNDKFNKDVLSDPLFKDLMTRFLTIRARAKVFVEGRLKRSFRKVFSAAILDVTSPKFKEYSGRALETIQLMFDVLITEFSFIEELEEKLKTQENASKYFGNGLKKENAEVIRGKVVAYKDGEDVCQDIFTDEEYIVKDKTNITMSPLLYSPSSPKRRRKVSKKPKPGTQGKSPTIPADAIELPAPVFVVPTYWQGICNFLNDPLKRWALLKVKLGEQFMAIINTAVIMATINNNFELLKYIEEMPIPQCIKEISLLSMEKNFDAGAISSKDAQRTRNMFSVFRVGPTKDVGRYHWRFDYLKKSSGKDAKVNALKSSDPVAVSIDALSVALNPVVRADLYHSRKRKSCEDSCGGHKGMLLATLVRLGHKEMVDYIIKQGVSFNSRMCMGDAASIYWDFSEEMKLQRARNAFEKAKNTQKKSAEVEQPKPADKISDIPVESAIKADEVELRRSRKRPVVDPKEVKMAEVKPEKVVSPQVKKVQAEASKQAIRQVPSQKEARDAVMNQPEKKQEKQLYEANDYAGVRLPHKGVLQSKYRRITPLTVAVDSAVTDIYTNRVSPRKKFGLSAAELKKKKEEDDAAVEDMNKRMDLVESFLSSGGDVLACDLAALRACLPAIETLVKAGKLMIIKNKKKKAARVVKGKVDTLDKKLERRTSKAWMKAKAAEIAEQKPKNQTSSELLASMSFIEGETLQKFNLVSSKPRSEKVKLVTAAMNAWRIVTLVGEEVVKQLNQADPQKARKYKGKYAAIVVRFTLIHEAILRGKWDVVRYLAPYNIDRVQSASIARNFPELDVYDSSWKEVDIITAQALKRTVELLFMELQNPRIATAAHSFNGIYFIMKEYNLTLTSNVMSLALNSIIATMANNDWLKAGEHEAITRLLLSNQVAMALQIRHYPFYYSRSLNRYCAAKRAANFKPMKNAKADSFKAKLSVYCFALNMSSVTDLLESCFDMRTTRSFVGADALEYALTRKKMFEGVSSILLGANKYNLTKQVDEIISGTLELYLTGVGLPRASDSLLVLQLLSMRRPGVHIQLSSACTFLDRLIIRPFFGPEQDYNGGDVVADLSMIFAFQEVISFVYYTAVRKDKALSAQTFEAQTASFWKLYEHNKKIWLQGLDIFFQMVFSLHPEFEPQSSSDSAAAKLLNLVDEKMLYTLQFRRDARVLMLPRPELETESACQDMDVKELANHGVVLDERKEAKISELL